MNCKVKVLTNLGLNDFPDTPFTEGEEPVVTELVAEKLISCGVAKLIEKIEPAVVVTEPLPVDESTPVVQEVQSYKTKRR